MFPDPLLGGDWALSSRGESGPLTGVYERKADSELEPTPYDVVHEENTARLRHYESEADEQQAAPVVFVYAFVNTPAILDLDPDRSVVGQFLARGYDVYVIEWLDASTLDAHLTLDDYVGRYLDGCVDAARRKAGVEAVNLVGIFTGSTLAAIYAGLRPEKLRAMALHGAPLDFDVEGGIFDFRDLVEAIDHEQLVDALGNVPASMLEAGFTLRKPIEHSVGVPVRLAGNLGHEEDVARFGRLARWAADGPDLPGGLYRQFVQELFLENALLDEGLTVNGHRSVLQAVSMPVSLVLGADDEYVPRAASAPYLDAIASEDTAIFEVPAGHVGALVDGIAHDDWWPRVVEWFVRR